MCAAGARGISGAAFVNGGRAEGSGATRAGASAGGSETAAENGGAVGFSGVFSRGIFRNAELVKIEGEDGGFAGGSALGLAAGTPRLVFDFGRSVGAAFSLTGKVSRGASRWAFGVSSAGLAGYPRRNSSRIFSMVSRGVAAAGVTSRPDGGRESTAIH